VSNADDLLAFSTMMLNHGRHGLVGGGRLDARFRGNAAVSEVTRTEPAQPWMVKSALSVAGVPICT
jgi:hypothetical protein